MPVLQDGDFVLTESRAIAQYVANAYAKDGGKLYPKEPKVRAKVDQMMYFDTVNLFRGFLNIFVSYTLYLESEPPHLFLFPATLLLREPGPAAVRL